MNGLHTLPHTRISARLIRVNTVYTLLRRLRLLVFCKGLSQDRPTGLCILLGSADKLVIKLKLMINLLEGMHFPDLRLHIRDVGTFEIQAKSPFSVVSSSIKSKLPAWSNKHVFSTVPPFFPFRSERNSQTTIPGSKLILTPPGEFSKALVALVVVVKHSAQCGSAQVHQSVVSCLLLFPAGVAVKQVIYLICNF